MNNTSKKSLELYDSIQKFSSGTTKSEHLYSNFNSPKQNEAFLSLVKHNQTFNFLKSIHIKNKQSYESKEDLHNLTLDQYNKQPETLHPHILNFTVDPKISGYDHQISEAVHSIISQPEPAYYTPTINLTNPLLRPFKR